MLVNAVAPGFIATEMTTTTTLRMRLPPWSINCRRGDSEPGEIAEVVAFFASDRNSIATGQVIVCDGGYTCL